MKCLLPAPPWPLLQKTLIWSTKLLFSTWSFFCNKMQIYRVTNLKYEAMRFIFLLLAVPLLNQECNKSKDTVPTCIQQKIEQVQKETKWNPPAEVNEYNYEGKRVYLFTSPCCDQYNNLYDSDCNLICAPSGGYTGTGDSKCRDFFEKAKHVKLIWKDHR